MSDDDLRADLRALAADEAAAIRRVEESRRSHAEWAEHIPVCEHCQQHGPPPYIQPLEEHQRIVAEYDNVLAVLRDALDAHEPATDPGHEGCDCTELCSMGPTCPGGMLAGLPGSGCWRSRPSIEDVLNTHAGTTSGGDKRHVYCRPECGWTGNDWVQHRAHVAQAIREARAV